MDRTEILGHIKAMLQQIHASPRWSDPNAPCPGTITDIGVRVGSAEAMQAFRRSDDDALLLDVACDFEESLNDDWMPYTICGLELSAARAFIGKLLCSYDQVEQGRWGECIRNILPDVTGKS